MAMQVGEHDTGEDTPMSDINTTPLGDVMLVLLIIFLITVPVVLQTAPVRLPKVDFQPTVTKPENHIRGDVDTPYRCVGGAIFAMQRAGFARIGFISEPIPTGGRRM